MRLDLSALSPSLTGLSFSELSIDQSTSSHYRGHVRNNFYTPPSTGYNDTGRREVPLSQRQLSHLRLTGNNELELGPEDEFLANEELWDDDHEGVAFLASQVFVQTIGNFLSSLRENPGVHFLIRASLFF